MEPLIPDKIPRTEGYAPRGFNPLIKFTYEEVEAMIELLNGLENDITPIEQSAREKFKRIYARQILSHEKREQQDRSSDEQAR